MILLISGDGHGAGKSTFARLLVGESNVWSFARAIREELAAAYPCYPWFSKEQRDKDMVVAATGRTIRDMLRTWGEERCAGDPLYYARRLADRLERTASMVMGTPHIAVDDLRKTVELTHIKSRFRAVHFHLATAGATAEPQYDNGELKAVADYVVSWRGGSAD